MTENRFNAKLTLFLRKTKTHYVKVNDRTTVGISDFLIWHEGMSAGLEVKRILAFPKKEKAKLLSHPFSRPQLRFLKNMQQSGNLGWGLISIHQTKTMYLINPDEIPDSGNWTLAQFLVDKNSFKSFDVNDFKGLFKGIFYGDEQQVRRIIQQPTEENSRDPDGPRGCFR